MQNRDDTLANMSVPELCERLCRAAAESLDHSLPPAVHYVVVLLNGQELVSYASSFPERQTTAQLLRELADALEAR